MQAREEKMIVEARLKAYNKKAIEEQRRAERQLAEADGPLSKQSLEQEVEQAFKQYDQDGDGQLNVEEARLYLEDWIKRTAKNKEDVQDIKFEDLDLDGNGFIDKEELRQFLFDQRMLHSEVF